MAHAKTYPPHALGVWGEELAARSLESDGWRVLERNYRLGRHEVDVIAVRLGILAFVEVKTRSTDTFGPPEEAVTHRKRREIEKVARDFLSRHRPGDVSVRFDVVAIVVTLRGQLVRYDHIEDAWRP